MGGLASLGWQVGEVEVGGRSEWDGEILRCAQDDMGDVGMTGGRGRPQGTPLRGTMSWEGAGRVSNPPGYGRCVPGLQRGRAVREPPLRGMAGVGGREILRLRFTALRREEGVHVGRA